MLDAIDSLRSQVKQRKENIYVMGAVKDWMGTAAELRELQSKLDDPTHQPRPA